MGKYQAYEKYKDSGVEWLGKIPQHWEVKRLRYIGSCQNGISKGADYFGSGYPFVNYTDVYANLELPKTVNGLANSTDTDRVIYSVKVGDIFFTRTSETIEEIVTEPSAYITQKALKECSLKIVPKGSVIVGIVGQGKTRGLSAYLGIQTTINQNMVAIVPSKFLEGEFLYLFLKQAYTSIRNLGRGANQPALDTSLINKFPITIPPSHEQKSIVHYLYRKEIIFFTTMGKIQQAIELLKEYRTALITNAVTGKIDVRQVPIPQPQKNHETN